MTKSRPIGASVLALVVTACSSAAQAPRSQVPTDVVATVGDRRITLADVDARALQQTADSFGNLTLSQAVYEARRAVLDEMVANELIEREARALGVEPGMLRASEITSKAPPPTEADVAAWYESNQGRVQGASLDQVRAPIQQLLSQERTREARQRYVETLKAKTAVRLSLEPPRQAVSAAGRPMRGPAGAPIEIIEFSDFECPFCQRVVPTVAKVLETYGDQVRLVYRHYPLPNHENARGAAEASACAHEQEQFWPFHDRLFASPAKLTSADLKQHAADLGMDAARFNACLDSRKYEKEVDADIAAANDAGISGTPLFFINGRPLEGSQPFEAFKRVIDEELALKR